MSGAIMNKIWGAFGMDANEEEEEDYVENNEEMEEEEENNKENKLWGRRNNKVVAMPQPQQVKMVISQPTTFDQAEDICDLLKEKQSVIVNLEYVNKDVARRIKMREQSLKNSLDIREKTIIHTGRILHIDGEGSIVKNK